MTIQKNGKTTRAASSRSLTKSRIKRQIDVGAQTLKFTRSVSAMLVCQAPLRRLCVCAFYGGIVGIGYTVLTSAQVRVLSHLASSLQGGLWQRPGCWCLLVCECEVLLSHSSGGPQRPAHPVGDALCLLREVFPALPRASDAPRWIRRDCVLCRLFISCYLVQGPSFLYLSNQILYYL